MPWRWTATLALLAAVACGNKDDSKSTAVRGSDDLGEGALALVEAIKKGDDAAALRLLVAPHQCASISKLVPRSEDTCREMAEDMLASLPAFRAQLEGFEPGVPRAGTVPAQATSSAHRVSIEPKGGGKPIDVAAIELDGRFYYLLPLKKKEAAP